MAFASFKQMPVISIGELCYLKKRTRKGTIVLMLMELSKPLNSIITLFTKQPQLITPLITIPLLYTLSPTMASSSNSSPIDTLSAKQTPSFPPEFIQQFPLENHPTSACKHIC
ncbi:hypothetical protein ACOSQ2_019551 [Xanthoceras sorbifolium]